MLKDLIRTLKVMLEGVGNLPREGRRIAGFALLITLVGFFSAVYINKNFVWLFNIAIILFAFVMFFFRNPGRNLNFKPDEIVSPADGRIISIKVEDDPDIVVIRIFLSIFDVHIQRSPITAKVEEIKYTKGLFSFASNDDAKNNERNSIKLSDGTHSARVEQITGAVARRIFCWVKQGDEIKTAQDIGLICFGSQVALYLPKNKVRIFAKAGQKVQGGLTIIALWQN